jgi:hypothetical protein
VTFQRVAPGSEARGRAPSVSERQVGIRGRILLVSCSKSKGAEPAPACELYVSPRFKKAKRFAEGSGDPWFILSAEHGLVAPDEWLAPYERYLADTSGAYRRAWGEWVVARLELLSSGLSGVTVEVHAGRSYAQPLRDPLGRAGARIDLPLAGLSQGRQLQWYASAVGEERVSTYSDDISPTVEALADETKATPAQNVRELARERLAGPGLYAWFVDEAGASDLSRGLEQPVQPGLIYVGQTGATKWPTGRRSASTLRSRILGQHLGGRRSSSTLRRTLGAILDEAHARSIDRKELSDWMTAHLSVTPMVVADGDVIGDLESQVVRRLDPPLNLDHTDPTPIRVRLRQLRVATAGRE